MASLDPRQALELRWQVRSPLRAWLLARIQAAYRAGSAAPDLDSLSRATGHLRRDVERCLEPLVARGVLAEVATAQDSRGYSLHPDLDDEARALIDQLVAESEARVRHYDGVRELYFAGMIGRDDKMKLVFQLMTTIARTDVTVLILGETGTGKELVARAIHEMSGRARGPFEDLNCAAIPEALFESEVFGHERGAFTGALARKPGKMEMAHKGTLFLDELGELSLANQVKLLRALQDRAFQRVGGTERIRSDFRLISATNRNLEALIEAGRFREDLFYRVNVFPIHLPSLRERRDDIPDLARELLQRFWDKQSATLGESHTPTGRVFDPAALDALCRYDWPGNVRQLENVVTRLAIGGHQEVIGVDDVRNLLAHTGQLDTPAPTRWPSLREVERTHIVATLRRCGGNIRQAAQALGITRTTLYNKISDPDAPIGAEEYEASSPGVSPSGLAGGGSLPGLGAAGPSPSHTRLPTFDSDARIRAVESGSRTRAVESGSRTRAADSGSRIRVADSRPPSIDPFPRPGGGSGGSRPSGGSMSGVGGNRRSRSTD